MDHIQPSASDAAATPATGSRYSYRVEKPALGSEPSQSPVFWAHLVLGGSIFYLFYGIVIATLKNRWYSDPSWSHGFLVPLFSAFLVYQAWDRLVSLPIKPNYWLGLPLFLFACFGNIFFLIFGQYNSAHLSLLVCLIGLTLFLFGVDHLRILWLPICYLLFCIPIPEGLYVRMTAPLQELAAGGAATLLPLFGIQAERHGVEITVPRGPFEPPESLNVAEACSGMRMVVAFFALAVILAYSKKQPMWHKLFLSCCALPIALLCNILRVTLIGILFIYINRDYARGTTHQWVGLLMLIPAMGLQLGLAWVLDRIFVDDGAAEGAAK